MFVPNIIIMSDTTYITKVIHDTVLVQVPNPNALDIVTRVDDFYAHSWSNLMTLGAIIGAVIPLLYGWYQRRLYNLNKKELSEEIAQEITAIKISVDKEIDKKIKEEFEGLNDTISLKLNILDGRQFHLQANNNQAKGSLKNALVDYYTACKLYLKGKDFLNLQIILKFMYENSLRNIHTTDYDNLVKAKLIDIEDLIKELSDKNERGFFTLQITSLRQALIDLEARKQSPTLFSGSQDNSPSPQPE
jgi:hypothetical protein